MEYIDPRDYDYIINKYHDQQMEKRGLWRYAL